MISWLLSCAAAVAIVAAWWMPSSVECAALGWTSAILFAASLQQHDNRIRRTFVAGLILYAGGFYWLFSTISDFGGFPTAAALAIFGLFVAGSSIQLTIWAFTFGRLPEWFARMGLRTAFAWLVAHHFWIKIFPWDFGHTQIGFVPFAQIADVVGVTGITWIMLWVAECSIARRSACLGARLAAFLVLLGSLGYGVYAEQRIHEMRGHPLNISLIQGNVSLQRKHDMSYFTVNREQYVKTSSSVADKDTLVVWPESTITEFIPAAIDNAYHTPLLPFLNNGSAFLVGGLTYQSRQEYFNSSLLVRPDGTVDKPYNKMILMPFGEYTPMSSWFPWLADINSTAGQFTAGKAPAVLSFPLSDGWLVKLSPLICYEDVVPLIARDATQMGAELLINQTNDAWFGRTVAPYQHHMIASFRAIENRRFLLRSTNTGLTAVVDPLGRTLAAVEPFTESVLSMEVELLSSHSVFTRFPIYLAWLFLAALGVLIVALPRRSK